MVFGKVNVFEAVFLRRCPNLDFSVQPLCSLRLCGYLESTIQQPQRHRGRRGFTEKKLRLGHI